MKLAIIQANLGNFDKPVPHVEQELPHNIDSIQVHAFTDTNFPPRKCSMTPRLQARIPKMFSWQMMPGFDYYLWVDASCRLPRADSAKWFLDQLGEADAAFFKHNRRNTVQEEADYLKKRLEQEKSGQKAPYVLPRYENERIDAELEVVDPKAQLYATTAFIYKDSTRARDMLTIWWLHTSLYHSIDQLGLPTAIEHANAKVNVIEQDYLKCKYLEYVR